MLGSSARSITTETELADFEFSDQPPSDFKVASKSTPIPDKYVHWHEISRTLLNTLFESTPFTEARLNTFKFLLGPALLPTKQQDSDEAATITTVIADYKLLAKKVLRKCDFIRQHSDELIIKPQTKRQMIANIIEYKSDIMTSYTDSAWIQSLYDAIMRIESLFLKLKMRLELNKHAITQRTLSIEFHLHRFNDTTSSYPIHLKISAYESYHDQLAKIIPDPLEWAELRLALRYLPNQGRAMQCLKNELSAYIDERDTLYWKPWLQSCFFVQDRNSLNRRRHVELLISFMHMAKRNENEFNISFKDYLKNGILIIIRLVDYEDALHTVMEGALTHSKFRTLLQNFIQQELTPSQKTARNASKVAPIELTTVSIFKPALPETSPSTLTMTPRLG